MSNPVLPEALTVGQPVPPDPGDRLGALGKWVVAIFAQAAVAEAIALSIEKRNHETGQVDRVKRTISAVTRWAAAFNSTTGQPLDVPFGRLRRAAFIMFCAWFVEHIKRTGTENRL